jgi:hypothetical protein
MKKLILTTLLSISAASAVYAQEQESVFFMTNSVVAEGANQLINVDGSRDFLILAKMNKSKYMLIYNENNTLNYATTDHTSDHNSGVGYNRLANIKKNTVTITDPKITEKFGSDGIDIARITYNNNVKGNDLGHITDNAIKKIEVAPEIRQALAPSGVNIVNCIAYKQDEMLDSTSIKFNTPEEVGYIYCRYSQGK